MADEDVATKAPESDLAEQSAIPGDTVVDQGASMGHLENPPQEMTKFGNVDAYITKPADYPHSPSKLLLFLTGGTGIHSTNNKLQADRYAAEGFLVVMPDQFNGDPAPNTSSTIPLESQPSFIERVKLGIAEAAKSFSIDMWLARHTPATVLPTLHRVIDALRDEFADAIANGGGIYGVGYCFGAKYILLLASESAGQQGQDKGEGAGAEAQQQGKAEEGLVRKGGPALKTGVIAHGTMVEREDFAKIEVPVGIVAVENDGLFPDEVREHGVKALKDKGVEVESWVYPGVPHGFAVVGDYEDATIKAAQKQAFDVMLGWLKNH
ncbi:hypothetical protein MBLNU459_g5923t1 [Dothideomycetes sp. NU459]